MQLFVKADDQTILLQVDEESNEDIGTVKHRLEEQEGIVDVEHQRLMYAGKQLDDDCTISDYNIQNGSTLELFQGRLRGGITKKKTKTVVVQEEIPTTTSTITKNKKIKKDKTALDGATTTGDTVVWGSLKKKKKKSVTTDGNTTRTSLKKKKPVKIEQQPTKAKQPADIEKIIVSHNKAHDKDIAAFKRIRWLDEVWETDNPEDLQGIASKLEGAKKRQAKLRKAIATHWTDVKNARKDAAYVQAQQFQSTMLSHFPPEFQNPEVDLRIRVDNLKKSNAMTPKKQEKHRQALYTSKRAAEKRKTEKAAYFAAIKYVYDFEKKEDVMMADPFFSKPVNFIGKGDETDLEKTKEERRQYKLYNDMEAATKTIIERAYEMLDYRATPEEVEKAMEHIPPGFWPPQLVEDLQAWRHVEREFIWEKVNDVEKDLAKSADGMLDKVDTEKKGGFGSQDVKAILGTIGDVTALLGASGTVAKAFSKVELKSINLFLKEAKHSANIVAKVKQRSQKVNKKGKTEKTDPMKNLKPAEKALIVAQIADLVSAFGKISQIANVSPAGKAFVEQVCPALSIFGYATETVVFTKAAIDSDKARKQVVKELENIKGLKKKALQAAFENEKSKRNQDLAHKSVHAIGRATITGGAIASVVGPTGAIASVPIKFVGKSIEVGNKIVMAGIDWKKAKKAQKTKKEARAGSYPARRKIFKDSNSYAKMFIAMAAKKGDEDAKNFIVSRGLTDVDFSDPMSAKIIREALLKKSGQVDDEENESFFHNLAGIFAGPTAKKKLRAKKKNKSKKEKTDEEGKKKGKKKEETRGVDNKVKKKKKKSRWDLF